MESHRFSGCPMVVSSVDSKIFDRTSNGMWRRDVGKTDEGFDKTPGRFTEWKRELCDRLVNSLFPVAPSVRTLTNDVSAAENDKGSCVGTQCAKV